MNDQSDTPARYLPRNDYREIKRATDALVHAAGGCVQAAGETRVGPSYLSRYGNEHEAMFAPIDVIADLEAMAGDPVVTRKLADLAGFALVPKVAANDTKNLMRHLSVISKESGEAVSGLASALADGSVNAQEARRLVREMSEAIDSLCNCQHALKALVDKAA